MSDDVRAALAERAGSIEPPGFEVSALVRQGEARLRRRRVGVLAGGVLAVALAIGVPAVVADLGQDSRTIDRPKPPDKEDGVVVAPARPVVYADGSVLHVGARTFDTGLRPGSGSSGAGMVATPAGPQPNPLGPAPDATIMTALYATDDGAVFTTANGLVWFSDGTSMERIGGVPGADQDRVGAIADNCGNCLVDGVATDEEGSTVVWLEHAARSGRDLVVYDTAQRAVVRRWPLPIPERGYAYLDELYGNYAYWTLYPKPYGGPRTQRSMRTDVATGTHEPASEAVLAAARSANPRLVVGRGAEREIVTAWDNQSFQRKGAVLEPVRFDHDVTNANYFVPAFHPVTGQRLSFLAPAEIAETNELVVFAWLDADRFVLSNRPSWYASERRDVVTCTISTQSCAISESKKPGHWLALPGWGMPG